MNRRRMLIPVVGAICLGFMLTLLLLSGKSDGSKAGGVDIYVAGSGCHKAALVEQAMSDLGFADGSYVVGEQNIDFNAPEANERSSNASFSSQTPKSAQEVVAELQGNSPRATAALNHIIEQSGTAREAVLDSDNWVAVQINQDFLLQGNTGFDGTVFDAGTRHSQSGDVIWFFVNQTKCRQVADGKVKPEDALTAHRGACGNPQNELPKPNPGPGPSPTPPPAPPTTPPTTAPCGLLCKGPDREPAPCVDSAGVRCDGIPGSGGQPGSGGAISHGDDGYSPSDPPPPPVVTTVPPPTSVATLPPTSLPPTPGSTIPPPPG